MSFEEYIEENKRDNPFFRKAFVHKSYKNVLPHYETNETLEIIGDKALDLVLYEHLYNSSEGKITKQEMDDIRQEKTSKKGLATVLDYYDLQKYIEVHEPKQDINDEVKHNIIEALAGAIFLSERYPKTEELLKKYILFPEID
jgi:dsRNA-specific ribonuclease